MSTLMVGRLLKVICLPFFFSWAFPFWAGHSPQEDWFRQGSQLLRESRYPEAESIFRQWVKVQPGDPDAHFYLALSLALQQRFEEALPLFKQVRVLSPGRADAAFEISAALLELNRPEEAFQWVAKGLDEQPEDAYGLELAGTLSFILNSKGEALGYWNRINRPHLTQIDIVAGDRVDRYSIAEEIELKPKDLLSRAEIEKASWRLAQHPHLRSVEFDPVPGANADEYSLTVRVASRSGFGSPAEFLENTFGQVAFRTLRLSYWNLAGSGTTVRVPIRWNPDARWFQFALESPRPAHLPVYTTEAYDWRDESWDLGSSGKSFRLRRHQLSGAMVFPVILPRLTGQVDLGYRWRRFSADSPSSLPKVESAGGVFFAGIQPALSLFRRTPPLGWSFASDLRSEFRASQIRGVQSPAAFRTSFSWETRMSSRSENGLRQLIEVGIHAGWSSDQSLVEDHFMLGMGPDADFALRAHPIFREGKKGLSPVAARFALANLSWRKELHRIGLLRLGIILFNDVAAVERSFLGEAGEGTLIDSGGGVELGWGPLRSGRFTLAYGRDWKGHRNALYVGTRFP